MPAEIDKTFEYGGPAYGTHLGTFGFPARTVYRDALTAITDPDDLIGLFKGATNHALVVPQINTGASYLFLTHHWASTGTTATNTVVLQAPIVRVYGLVPRSDRTPAQGNGRDAPEDTSTNFGGVLSPFHTDISEFIRGIWVPLTKPNYTKGTPGLTLDQVAIRTPVSTTSLYAVSEEEYVFCAGCSAVVVVVATAATFTEGNADNTTTSVIVGRFGG